MSPLQSPVTNHYDGLCRAYLPFKFPCVGFDIIHVQSTVYMVTRIIGDHSAAKYIHSSSLAVDAHLVIIYQFWTAFLL